MTTGGAGASVAGSLNDVRAEVAELLGVTADSVDPGGNLVLIGSEPLVVVVGADDTRPRHRPHFATCPDADDWRRNRKENDS